VGPIEQIWRPLRHLVFNLLVERLALPPGECVVVVVKLWSSSRSAAATCSAFLGLQRRGFPARSVGPGGTSSVRSRPGAYCRLHQVENAHTQLRRPEVAAFISRVRVPHVQYWSRQISRMTGGLTVNKSCALGDGRRSGRNQFDTGQTRNPNISEYAVDYTMAAISWQNA